MHTNKQPLAILLCISVELYGTSSAWKSSYDRHPQEPYCLATASQWCATNILSLCDKLN